MLPQRFAHKGGTILFGSTCGLIGGAQKLLIEDNLDCFHVPILLHNMLHSILHTLSPDEAPFDAPHHLRIGFCIGTTCTVTSRTSERKRLSTEPRSRISHRDRTGCPKTTCEMLSCCAKRIRASETLRSTSDTT